MLQTNRGVHRLVRVCWSVAWIVSAACSTPRRELPNESVGQRAVKREPAAVVPQPQPTASRAGSCSALSEAEIRAGTSMRRSYSRLLPRGELNTLARARRSNGKFVFQPLEILDFRERSAAEVEAAEAALRRQPFTPTDWAKLERSDGTHWWRTDHYFLPDSNGIGYDFHSKIPTGPDVRAVRFTIGDEVVFDYRQPQDPPGVEAVVLREKPLRLALRVRGFSGAVLVELAEVTPGGTEQLLPLPILIHEQRRPGTDPCWLHEQGPGADPCWLVLPSEYGFTRDTGLPLRLTLVDLFYRIVFDYARNQR